MMLKRTATLMTVAFALVTCQDKLYYYLNQFGNYFSWLWLGPGPH